MRRNKLLLAVKNERLGLTMILASLTVIMVTVFLLFLNQLKDEETHIREQGTSLARILSRIPFEQFTPSSGLNGILSVLQHDQENTSFAYLAVIDTQGKPLTEITSPGILVPGAQVSSEPTAWLGERSLSLPASGRGIHEFHAPLFANGQIAGHIRLGYFKPGFGLRPEQLPLFATFALPIFLLTPLFYFLVRREVKPLSQVNHQLDKLVEQGALSKVELTASDDLHDFMSRFNQFVNSAQKRIGELEADRSKLATSAKLLGYKRSRVESVLQSFPDAVIVLDESGTVSLANARIGSILDIPPEEIIGKKPAEWFDNPEIVAFLASHEGRTTRGDHSDAMEFSPPASPDRTIAISPYPLFSPKDATHILGTLIIFRDITAEKQAQRTSNEFVAHVSHELKTPLNVLTMYSESLLGEEGKDEVFRIEATNVIHDEVERLTMLINNILSISKIEMGSINIERKRVKLRDLLQDAFDTCARSGQDKNLDFQLDLPKEISPVALDKNLMRIAINNLLTNAIKYSDPNGMVTLSVEETEMTVRIAVRDNGIGIAAEEQNRIFDKFYRSEDEAVRERTGHGLGLPLAREIIQLHHGTLTVNSSPGAGSEFIVEFNKETDLLKQAV